jgi:hypothetical protein
MSKETEDKKASATQLGVAFIGGAATVLAALMGLLKTDTPVSNTIINNILPGKYAAIQQCEKQNQQDSSGNSNDSTESGSSVIEPGATLISKSKDTGSSSFVLKGKLLPDGQAEGRITVKGQHSCTEPALAILDENGIFTEVALLPKVCTENGLTGQDTPEKTVSWEVHFAPASMKHYSLYRVKWDGSFNTGLIPKAPHIQNALNSQFH